MHLYAIYIFTIELTFVVLIKGAVPQLNKYYYSISSISVFLYFKVQTRFWNNKLGIHDKALIEFKINFTSRNSYT